MNNFFEQELQKLFGDGMIIGAPAFSGRSCYGTLGKDLRVRAQFITTRVSDEYDALKLTVLNRTEGQVDVMILRLKDLLGKKPVPGNPNFPNGVSPYIWNDYGKLEWYAFHPTPADYETIRQAAEQYLDVFRDRQQERAQDGPKLVYIPENRGTMSTDRKAALRARLDQNYKDFMDKLQGKNASELIAMASEITAAQMLHEELLDTCDKDDVEFLLRFNDPLEVVRGYWESELTGYDHSGEIGHMLWEIWDKEMYSKDQLAQPEKVEESLPPPGNQGKKSQQKKEKKSHER